MSDPHSIKITDFREQCLSLVNDLPAEGLVLTRHGKPIARITPIRPSFDPFIGSVPNLVAVVEDDLFSTGIAWDAQP